MKIVTLPFGSGTTATPAGPASRAAVPGPPSPQTPHGPPPRPGVARIAPRAAARDRRDRVRPCIDLANPVVVHVGNVEIAVARIDGHVARHVEMRLGRRAAVADVLAIARQ